MVFDNVREYLDRSTTLAALVVVALLLVVRQRPRLGGADRRVLALAAIWAAGLFAVTVWLPVRSSLYAVTPSVGPALAAGLVASRLASGLSARAHRVVLAGALLLPVLLWPVFHARNQRLANEARLSAEVMRALARLAGSAPPADGVRLVDDPQARPSFYHAFGSLLPDAAALAFGRPVPVSLDNTPEPSLSRPLDGLAVRRIALVHGRPVDR